MKLLSKQWFARDAVTIAQELLGKIIVYKNYSGMIVETEAYMGDPASHAHTITPRSQIIRDTYGVVYVYFIYGMYHCLNFTTNKGAKGAVLIRALEPLAGIAAMKRQRKTHKSTNLTSGPGKLCQAFGITKALNGSAVNEYIQVWQYRTFTRAEIGKSARIGITKATDLEWRFFVKGSRFISR